MAVTSARAATTTSSSGSRPEGSGAASRTTFNMSVSSSDVVGPRRPTLPYRLRSRMQEPADHAEEDVGPVAVQPMASVLDRHQLDPREQGAHGRRVVGPHVVG